MQISLPLDRMTIADKLRTIEEIWNDLLYKSNEIPSPTWHKEILCTREQQLQNNELQFIDWEQAKIDIREQMK